MNEAQAAPETPAPGMQKQSRIGKRPIVLPKGASIVVADGRFEVKGPKGTLAMVLPETTAVTQEGDRLIVTSDAPVSDAPRLQGLARALIASLVKGATEGYAKTLEFHGTGYRAELTGKTLTCLVGKSHPEVIELPATIACEIPKDSKGTVVHLASADKAVLGQVAATIKGFRPPEPYGGKGIRFRGEVIRRKAGKTGKK